MRANFYYGYQDVNLGGSFHRKFSHLRERLLCFILMQVSADTDPNILKLGKRLAG